MEYTVQLENFSGPLDLLLYLIKQEELEIHDISLSAVCDKYLEYVRGMKDVDVNVSAEFLVVAATLMLIKSRSLLPAEEEVDLDEELDPEDELIHQLLEYKKFKMATRDLAEMAELRSRIFPFEPPRPERAEKEISLEDLDVVDLVKAFAKILAETRLDRQPRLLRSEKPLRAYIEEVFNILKRVRRVRFTELFHDTRERPTIIGRFIAILELAKRGRVRVVQERCYDDIELEVADDRELSASEIEVMESDMAAKPAEDESAAPVDETFSDAVREVEAAAAASVSAPISSTVESESELSEAESDMHADLPRHPLMRQPIRESSEDSTEKAHEAS